LFKIAAHLLVKNEEDIIKECLDHLALFCDYIFILDNGSTDKTYEICKKHSCITYVEKKDVVYSDTLRQILVEKSKKYLTNEDWLLEVSADHFFASNPRLDVKKAINEGANIITYHVAQFYFTDLDLNSKSNEKLIQNLLQYYAINYHDFPVVFQNQSNLKYTSEVTEWPELNRKKIASFHPILKHYQFRSVEQIKKRLRLRYDQRERGFKGFKHYRTKDWQRYIFDHNQLNRFDGIWKWNKQPSLDELLGIKQKTLLKFLSAIKKKFIHLSKRII